MNKSGTPADSPRGESSVNSEGAAVQVSSSKRKFIRAGAASVPVLATLTSRPAHAWSCKSPSAWGSTKANPNTSHKDNAGHRNYSDETWTCANWKDNSSRTATGISGKPWDKLVSRYSAINVRATRTNGSFDYTKVTVDMLRSVVGLQVPIGCSTSANCRTTIGNGGFMGCCIAAQLNFILLAPNAANDIEKCLTLDELKSMSRLAYPSYSPWSSKMVLSYLNENWIVRVS